MATPTGGTITTDGLYTVHTFTSSGNFIVPFFKSGATAEVLVVAGGGGSGAGGGVGGAGAGGGLVYHNAKTITAQTFIVTGKQIGRAHV